METETQNQMWQKYRSKSIIEARPYVVGESLADAGFCPIDAEEASPNEGDFIVRIPLHIEGHFYFRVFTKEELDSGYEMLNPDTDIGTCGSSHQVIDLEADLNEELPTRTCNVGDGECDSCS